MIDFTVVIPTIGRFTLERTIESVVENDLPAIIVADGVNLSEDLVRKFEGKNIRFVKTGQKFGQYGSIATSLGAYLTETEFFFRLDDDDEIISGKGDIIKQRLASDPSVDIWIPGLLYNNGETRVLEEGLHFGNVCCPVYRTMLFAYCPMRHPQPGEWDNIHIGLDYWHVKQAAQQGYRIKWIGEPIIAVRPDAPAKRGYSCRNPLGEVRIY